jgi:uncharacterized alpha-E superfamily protein
MTQQQIAVPSIAKFAVHRPPRPLMARDADSMYWMSRYVERAEHIARLLLVHANLLVDVGDLTPQLQEQQWHSVLTIMRSGPLPAAAPVAGVADAGKPGSATPVTESAIRLGYRIARFMTFDRENPNSLVSCLTRARENARSIRENISAEMWESLNTLYWSIRSDEAAARFEDSPEDFYRQIMTGSFLFQGLTDQTLGHEQRWLFTQLGKFLERIDVTSRLLEVKFSILLHPDVQLDSALRNIHWMAVLRSGCSIEAYRRRHLADMDPLRVASFLILERKFPRSVRFCVGKAHEAIASVRAEVNPTTIDPAERILGRLDAQLEYAEPSEILLEGLPAYLQRIQTHVAESAAAVQKSYFLH